MAHTMSFWLLSMSKVPYLFELRHPVPRPNFDGVPLFKHQRVDILEAMTIIIHMKGTYIVSHRVQDINPLSTGGLHKIARFLSSLIGVPIEIL